MLSNKKSKFISSRRVGYGRILRLRPTSNGVKKKKTRKDVEKMYTKTEFIKKLRRFADALETERKFFIRIAGEKISVPQNAIINIEHEREKGAEEIEFQIKWKK